MCKNLLLPSTGVSPEIERNIRKGLVRPGYYGRLPPEIGNLAWSLYKMLLREKIIRTHRNLLKAKHRIVRDYEKGASLETLTTKYDQPPTSILRIILSDYYKIHNKKIIKELLTNENFIKSPFLSKNLVADLHNNEYHRDLTWALKNDVIAGADQHIVQEKAAEYEESIGRFLRKNNIRYKTQESLVAEQQKKYSRIFATPDFLLLDEVCINGKQVTWIDAKHYYGANIPIVAASINNQIKKYTKLWGHGALFFSAGFSSELTFENCMLVDFPLTNLVQQRNP